MENENKNSDQTGPTIASYGAGPAAELTADPADFAGKAKAEPEIMDYSYDKLGKKGLSLTPRNT